MPMHTEREAGDWNRPFRRPRVRAGPMQPSLNAPAGGDKLASRSGEHDVVISATGLHYCLPSACRVTPQPGPQAKFSLSPQPQCRRAIDACVQARPRKSQTAKSGPGRGHLRTLNAS